MRRNSCAASGRLAVFAAERRLRWLPVCFFAALLGLGILLCRDYGLSWDEAEDRHFGCIAALCALSPLSEGRLVPVSEVRRIIGADCYYGMGFEMLLVFAEYCMTGGNVNLSPRLDSDVWFLRHLLNFLLVWCGWIAVFLSGKLLWRRTLPALIPVLLFLLIPRFWAEAFYNCKDMSFLAAVAIAGFFLLRMMKFPTCRNAALFGVFAAFASSIRLSGGMLFAAGEIALFASIPFRGSPAKRLSPLFACAGAAGAALILLYPVGWSDPVRFFLEAIRNLTHYPWNSSVLFFGREYPASQVPWYYLPGWMAVTLPVPFLVFFFCGHLRCAPAGKRGGTFRRRCGILFAAFFWISLVAVMTGCRTCYNGWRQFYFLAWPMLFIASEGVLLFLRRGAAPAVRGACAAVLALWIASTVVWMWHVHPYQNLFFNVLAGDPNGRFELDYWYTASRDALRHIAGSMERSNEVATVALNAVNHAAVGLLPKAEQRRVKIVPQEVFCRYFIYHMPPQWRPELGGRPFRADFPTAVRVAHEVNIRTSLFLHPVFVYRIYEFTPAER